MTFDFGETVTLITRTVTGQDARGRDVYTDTTTTIAGCAFAPAGSIERVQGQDMVTTTPTVYLPDGTAAPNASAKVQVRGRTYDIDGEPQVFVNPFTGSTPGPVLRLKAVTG